MSTLIKGIPDEVSLLFLARVPLYQHPRLSLVSPAWKAAVNSVNLLKAREEVNFLEDFMCVCSSEPDNVWQLYDPQHDVWMTIPVPPQIKHLSDFGTVSTAGLLYVIGGARDPHDSTNGQLWSSETNEVWSYEPVTKQWTLCAPMTLARANFACGVLNGKIIVAGGFSNNSPQSTVEHAELYDPESDVWIPLPDLLHAHNTPCYGVVVRGKMHVLHKGSSQAQILDNETQAWTVHECPWKNHPLAVVGDAVYVMVRDEIYHEHPARSQKQVKFRASRFDEIFGFAMTGLGDSIYLIGGNQWSGDTFIGEKSGVTIITPSLEEQWALQVAKPMTRCQGTILGSTPLRM